ncbi:tetratricopeptide repeat protein [Archangium gephyra]|uniref:Adenylate cyclase n=1 Tax=Archangium gephyra TaxID=48 RepID=A0AAC8QB70_9BACT|nr:metallophosphoesterase [Archangium gephyra]AKJ04477.1 Adenylate cyclase [Archangium gephyra]REG37452.1 tetratricopeptide repeat protein [Archangium gephyra]
MAYPLRILHISDLHNRGTREKEPWRRRCVLEDAWKRNLDAFLEEGPVDLIAFTGDLAFSGHGGEYEGVTGFILATLERLKLGQDRLFLVPGNHDVDRSRAVSAWSALRSLLRSEDALELSRWMASEDNWAPRGFSIAHRDELLLRQEDYRRWVRDTLGRPELLPDPAHHPRLGYRATLRLPKHPFEIHIIGFDSAWLAGDEHDAGKLWLTDDQVMRLATNQGEALPGFRLALIHHPLDNLVDRAQVRRLLAKHTDLLLRGHLHEAEAELSVEPAVTLRSLAAGCLYEHDRYPNSCQLIQVTLDEAGRPRGYELRFRSWSHRGFWHDDDSLYPGSRGGRLRWMEQSSARSSVPHPRVVSTFVGRGEQLQDMVEALLPTTGTPRPVALHGMPGVGKSYLVDRFATLHGDRFPGGYVRLVLEAGAHQGADALLQALADRLDLGAGTGGLLSAIRDRLLKPPTLLCIDNVDEPRSAASVVELLRGLRGCAVIVAGRLQGMGVAAGWAMVRLRPFDEASALEQLATEYLPQDEAEAAGFPRLVRELGFLPLAIHLAAGYLRKGHTVNGFLDHLRRRKLELGPGDLADPLHEEGASRAILRRSLEISLGTLRESLTAEWGADAERFIKGLSALGFAPAWGVGRSLGAAITGLSEDDFGSLVAHAVELSVMDTVPDAERPRQRTWRIHPLLAEMLQDEAERERVIERMTEWFVQRLPGLPAGQESEQGRRWKSVQDEALSLIAWLTQVLARDFARVARAGAAYAQHNGPFQAWISFCERVEAESNDSEVLSDALWIRANISRRAGMPDKALDAARRKLTLDRAQQDAREEALSLGVIAGVLSSLGDVDEALRIWKEEALPVFERLGDKPLRAHALGNIADILEVRGELDEALRIRREEELPVYEQVGDIRSRAITLGRIADVLRARGDLDGALGIWRVEVLPAFERLGDFRARAIAIGKIADIFQARGELDEALRIRREEELPVYESVGDIRSRALILGKIANILQARGELDEALRIRREEELPVYERLGEISARAVTLGQIADVLQLRGELDEALSIRREEELPVHERLGDIRSRAITLGQIADIHQTRGEWDEALRILREEVLPVFERLGDIHTRAIFLGRIADILQLRGELEEALRIRREEELPVYERLGDIRERALAMGKVADVLQARGEFEEALRIRREEELPVYERLGDIYSTAGTLGKVAEMLQARGELNEALRIRREEQLPVYERMGLTREFLATLDQIVDILSEQKEFEEVLRILGEEALPLLEQLGLTEVIKTVRERISELRGMLGR